MTLPFGKPTSIQNRQQDQRLDTIKMCHSTYFPNVCVSVIFTYCQNGGETDGVGFYYLETDGVEFDTYWQNGGYKKISDIIFAEWHIFIAASSPGANKISCGSLYEGLHEVVHHIIGAQRGVGYERSG
jgi:hypothetical protein